MEVVDGGRPSSKDLFEDIGVLQWQEESRPRCMKNVSHVLGVAKACGQVMMFTSYAAPAT
jgi:hypothetical protein